MQLKQIAKYTTATLGAGSVSTVGPVLGAYFGGRSEVNYHLTKEKEKVDKLERKLQTQTDESNYYFWLAKEANRYSDETKQKLLDYLEIKQKLDEANETRDNLKTKLKGIEIQAQNISKQIENDFGSISSMLRWNKAKAVKKFKEIKDSVNKLSQ